MGVVLLPLGGQSRLKSEFEVLEGLGQGGFGDVLKVLSVCILCSSWLVSEQARNYLDGRLYAITENQAHLWVKNDGESDKRSGTVVADESRTHCEVHHHHTLPQSHTLVAL